MHRFGHIDHWVFDLDNTLYDAEAHIFGAMSRRMTDFVARHLGIAEDEADRLRHQYYLTYGTTLRGLMTEHKLPPEQFLSYVHALDISVVPPCAQTVAHLAGLPGVRTVFTNAPRHFAESMLRHLGMDGLFDGVFTIEDAQFWPKPHAPTYTACLGKFGIDPTRACMFEDMAVNLKPAHALGMTTVWLHGKSRAGHADEPHIHHKAENIKAWLQATAGDRHTQTARKTCQT